MLKSFYNVLVCFSDIYNNRQYHDQFGKLLQQLSLETENSKTIYADSVFVDTTTKLRGLYRDYVKRVYKGTAFNIDFRDSVNARDSINE